jgi:hypothetical protein
MWITTKNYVCKKKWIKLSVWKWRGEIYTINSMNKKKKKKKKKWKKKEEKTGPTFKIGNCPQSYI